LRTFALSPLDDFPKAMPWAINFGAVAAPERIFTPSLRSSIPTLQHRFSQHLHQRLFHSKIAIPDR
jgi:hypothetical protein